ncbi:SufS family cysteine desulfurase [Aerococcaceae bacterium NML191219]|nr:SufS family cysteine desulfurase [Aerococcaceae bacterium NML191219]
MAEQSFTQYRVDFPILAQSVNDEPLIYFDNAATTQKPLAVLNAMQAFYQRDYANIHRGVHTLAERSTHLYEQARQTVADFIHAKVHEVIFTSGTTAGINFLARGLVEPRLQAGDYILTTYLEHHSNLVPWQALAQRKECELMFTPLTENYQVDLSALMQLDTSRVKALAIQHVSNVLGVAQPIAQLVGWAKERDILVIVDGAQAVPHLEVDMRQLGVDAYCFSGHKLYGPTGIGVCYLNERWHADCEPIHYGGEMIHYVGDQVSDYKESPWKFEAGTPPIAEAIGLAAAIRYVQAIGLEQISTHETALLQRLVEGLQQVKGVQLYGIGHGIVSFNIDGVHPHDAATAYDMEGIALRAGHHCAQPLMRRLNVPATLRASLALYNTQAEVDRMIVSTKRVREFFDHGIG